MSAKLKLKQVTKIASLMELEERDWLKEQRKRYREDVLHLPDDDLDIRGRILNSHQGIIPGMVFI